MMTDTRTGSHGVGALTDPVRYPETAAPAVRTKRAFVLLALTLVLPGSAQVVTGDRRLGRRALRATFACWALLLVGIVLAVTDRTLVVGIVTHQWWSLLLIAALLGISVGWALLFLNTLRLIRMPLLDRGARPLVAGALGYRSAALRVGTVRAALWSAATYAAAIAIAAAALRAADLPRLIGPAMLTLVFFLWDAFHGASPARRRDPRWIWQTALLVVLGAAVIAWNLRIGSSGP